ncbi:putative reverse transcriptase domain-containing protein, partial [Tanacetum coccineum]
MSGQLNMLRRDRHAHACTARLMETEAGLSRDAWVQSMDASDTARSKVRALWTTVLAQQNQIRELRAAGRMRQTQLIKALTLMRTLQTYVTALQSQQGPASGLARPKIPEDAGKMAPKRTTRSTPATITTPTTSVTDEQLKRLIDQGVANALAARVADKSRNGKDSRDSGTGGNEGVVELTQWFERMEPVFCISNYSMENQIKFSTCILLGSALTWWNSHVKTVGRDVAYAMTWTNLKKKMTDKYCPRGEVKKLESEMWNLKIKGTDVDAIEFPTELMDKKIRTFAERQNENERKQDDNQQQQQNKRQNTGRVYAARSTANANTANNQRGTRAGQKPTCYECRVERHFKRECPKLKKKQP